jgi:tetratricopeptide (TPR) repeat protein/ribosomal protein S27E
MHVRCPHCRNPIDIVGDDSLSDVTCPACGSTFNLITGDQTVTLRGKTQTIGHFELLDKVGLGAFGEVWKARDTMLDRIVALKIPRRGNITGDEAEYFFRDARAAAQLTHLGIVNVFEVGRDGDTLYIASEFIEGATLADWIEARPLSTRESCELMIKVAGAIQHAHERGVIHRDLKPSNILLDKAGEPHVADFGLAKRDAGEITMTVDGQILGTPAYMSPEQAKGLGHEADARSDVYSLGVILFQLLTGEVPFRGSKAMLLVQIVNDEPPSPRKLNNRVPRDLETNCLKCLEKEPAKRYATAQDFAAELSRFQSGTPIRARSIGRSERTWRWCKRNPRIATLSVTVLALLSATAIVSTVAAWRIAAAQQEEAEARRKADAIAIREQRERTRAEVAEQTARQEAERATVQAAIAQSVADTLAGMYQGADPIGLAGYSLGAAEKIDVRTTAVELLDRGAAKIRKDMDALDVKLAAIADKNVVPAALATQLDVQARLMDKIGNVYTSYMRFDDAEPLLKKALAVRRRLFDDRHLAVAESLHGLAVFHFFAGDFDAAERCGAEALAIRRSRLKQPDLDVALSEFALAWATNFNLGARQAEAERLMRSAIKARIALLGEGHRDVGYARFGLAVILNKMPGGQTEATKELISAANIISSAVGDRRIGESVMLYVQGMLAQSFHNYKGMEDANRQAVARLAEVFGESHPIVSYVKRELASAMVSRGYPRAAERLYRDSLESDRRTLGRRPFVGHSVGAFARFLVYEHRFDEARQQFAEALDLLQSTLAPDSAQIATLLNDAAANDMLRGDLESAKQRCLESLRIFERASAEVRVAHESLPLGTLARVALAGGYAEAYRRSCEGLVGLHSENSDPHYSKLVTFICGWSPGALANPEVAVQLGRRAMSRLNDQPWAQQDLGVVLYRAGHFKEALAMLSESVTRQGGDGHLPGQAFLAMCHHQLNNKAEAIKWLERAEAWHAQRVEQKSKGDALRAANAIPSDRIVVADDDVERPREPNPFADWDETVLYGQFLKEAQSLIR